ncbi:MAG: inositol monophosphatase family protein [Actinomycetota bacterium]
MSVDLIELGEIAVAALDAVVPRLQEVHHEDVGADTKSSATDLVTEFDRWSESTMVDLITAARPGAGFIGEEGTTRTSTTGVVWLLDPIDGTTNFVYDLCGSSVSVAATLDGERAVGAVHDLVRDERFFARRDAGATRDGTPIRVSGATVLSTSLIATGFSYEADRRRAQATALVEVLPAVRDIRRFGGAAADLCSLACGRVDAYYERGLGAWDYAAGALIASEAGAILDDRNADGGAFIGATPAIADELFALLDRAGVHEA